MLLNQTLSMTEIVQRLADPQPSNYHIFIEIFCRWWYNILHENS